MNKHDFRFKYQENESIRARTQLISSICQILTPDLTPNDFEGQILVKFNINIESLLRR